MSATAYSLMSFLMTLAVIHLCGTEDGGMFSIAFSSAHMLLSVAMFGMRNYQATDVTEQFDSGEYISSRIITSFAMAIVCGVYAWLMGFEAEKRIVYLLFCGVKLFEAFSDVMEGIVHRKDRLDIASKSQFLRAILLIAVFTGALLAGGSLVMASFLAFISAAIGFFLCSFPTAQKYDRVSISTNYRRVGELLLQCLPLFLVAATNAYLTNAPKITIDLNMDDQAQAQFAIIYMPVFTIQLVSEFIFRPQINTMAGYFAAKEKEPFRRLIRTMTIIDGGLTLIALGGTYIFGVPVLSWIYGVDISGRKGALLIIVLSGGFYALTSLLCQALTVIRRQKKLLAGYLFVSSVTAMLSGPLVEYCGLFGGAILYLLSMVLMVICLEFFYIKAMNNPEDSRGLKIF